jgi:hypothetical protein
MANELITLESVNLFCGATPDASDASNHLVLSEIKLPTLDKQFTDHRPGGAPVGVEIDTVIARLECTFSLTGVVPQVMKLINSWTDAQLWYFVYGVLRDQNTGDVAQAAGVLKGKLGRVDPTNWSKGNILHHAYSIRGIFHYELQVAGEELYRWDFPTNTLVIGGVDKNAQTNALLNIASVTAAPVIGTSAGFQPGI